MDVQKLKILIDQAREEKENRFARYQQYADSLEDASVKGLVNDMLMHEKRHIQMLDSLKEIVMTGKPVEVTDIKVLSIPDLPQDFAEGFSPQYIAPAEAEEYWQEQEEERWVVSEAVNIEPAPFRDYGYSSRIAVARPSYRIRNKR